MNQNKIVCEGDKQAQSILFSFPLYFNHFYTLGHPKDPAVPINNCLSFDPSI